jgi:hypothetical protein
VSHWEVVLHPALHDWYAALADQDRARVEARTDYLAEHGPAARRPIVGKIEASRHANMKELIVPGNIRILFAFDPRTRAVLPVGGDKTHQWKGWYKTAIPLADDRFDQWLAATTEQRPQPGRRPRGNTIDME